MKNLTEDQKSILALNGYEYLDGRHCYAKVGDNVAIQQSQNNSFYIYITREKYRRGISYDPDGVFIGYFETLQELFKIVTVLSKYNIN